MFNRGRLTDRCNPVIQQLIFEQLTSKSARQCWILAAVSWSDPSRFRELVQFRVRKLLRGVGTSHTAFYQEIPASFPPQHTINVTLTSVENSGSPTWMFLDVFPEVRPLPPGLSQVICY